MSATSGWLYLMLGGVFEIIWVIAIKACLWWTLPISITAGAASVSCLYAVIETVSIGTVYVVWTGIGAAGTVFVGIVVFGESVLALRLGFLVFVAFGLIGLGYSTR